ncbi:MAG: hypothetical protein ACRDPM_23185 [Solirubrobacteraceae bacterium]
MTRPIGTPTPQIATTVAQAEHGSATFTGCDGDWGVSPTGEVDQPDHTGL